MILNPTNQFRPCLAAGLMDQPARTDRPVPMDRPPQRVPFRAPEPDDTVIRLADYADAAGRCHCDLNALLLEMLARFTNCAATQLDHEVKMAFGRACEFLEIERGGLWHRSGQNADACILTHVYPTPALMPNDGQAAAVSTTNGNAAPRPFGPLALYVGADSRTCFPWMTAQALRGQDVVLSNAGQLPPAAEQDKKALAWLRARSGAMMPILVAEEVVGAASFAFGRRDIAWPRELAERLKSVSQVLATAFARKIHLDELARSQAEIGQLKARLQAESEYLKTDIKVTQQHGEIIGRSQVISRLLHQVEQVAPADCAVLINGETGTGKELIAQEIHRLSPRKERHMVLVNCAALPSALVESELFGRERGAYTGALSSQVGRFEVANGSTLFLDEVGELSLEVQAKLLRVLQEGRFERLGSPKTHKVNVRVIAATNRDLAAEVRKGRFREDLYYRLKVFPIEIPPLRERIEDIPMLVFAFMEEFSTRMGKKITRLPRKAIETLQDHSWPGNIRELRNVIEHSVILSSGDTLKLPVLGDAPTREAQPVTLAEAERDHILKTLEGTGWRIKGPHGAATRLEMQPSTLYSRMQKLGIPHRRQKDEMPTKC